MNALYTQGFELIRGVFNEIELQELRDEAERVAQIEGSACVRNLRAKSKKFHHLATSVRLSELIPEGLLPVRSMLFDKTPAENWPVAWHQDMTITVKEKIEIDGYGPWSMKGGSVHVQPPEVLLKQMLTIRIHLDATPESNGALRVIPASHQKGKIALKHVLSNVNDSEVVCSCDAGDVLLMSPLLLHASSRSKDPKQRRIIHFEYAPLDCLDKRLAWQSSAVL